MNADRPTRVVRMILVAAIAAGVSACAMSHPSAREIAHYPSVNLAAPLSYNVIGVHSVNVSGRTALLAIRDRIEESVAICLKGHGIRTAANHTAADEDQIRWKPRRELDDAAAVALGKTLVVRGLLVIDLLELRDAEPTGVGLTNGLALDARLVDRNAGAVVWARKAGPIALPSLPVALAGRSWVGSETSDRSFDASICQLVETLSTRMR